MALFVLEFSGRPFPLEQFADGCGQLGQAEVGEIADSLADKLKLSRQKIAAGRGNTR